MNTNPPSFSDEDLMVFADIQADADLSRKITTAMSTDAMLATRVSALRSQVADVQNALDLTMLNAPQMPAHLTDTPQPRSFSIPLALAASFALGMVAMNIAQPAPDWIDRVASYQALYVQDTLAGGMQDPALTQAILSQTKVNVGIEIPAIPELSGMTFKRVQMLAIDDAPLVQIAYLAGDGTPFALCIVRVDDADQVVENTRSHNLAAATWITNGVGYLLIGGSDPTRVSDLATGLAKRI